MLCDNNMTVEGETEAEDCDKGYSFQDGAQSSVDPVEHTGLTGNHLFCHHFSAV